MFCRFDGNWFKMDGYEWKKRREGKLIREDHMKLKVCDCLLLFWALFSNFRPIPLRLPFGERCGFHYVDRQP